MSDEPKLGPPPKKRKSDVLPLALFLVPVAISIAVLVLRPIGLWTQARMAPPPTPVDSLPSPHHSPGGGGAMAGGGPPPGWEDGGTGPIRPIPHDRGTRPVHPSGTLTPVPPSIPRAATIVRFPSIHAPDSVVAEERFEVSFTLDESITSTATHVESGETTASGGLVLPAPASGVDTLEVILLAPAFGFEDAQDRRRLLLPSRGPSTEARFILRTHAAVREPTDTQVRALLLRGNSFLASVVRNVRIVPAGAPAGTASGGHARPAVADEAAPAAKASLARSAPQADRAGPPVEMFAAQEADLLLFIWRYPTPVEGSPYAVYVHSNRLHLHKAGSFAPDSGLAAYLQAQYRLLSDDALALSGEEQDSRARQLQCRGHVVALGEHLWNQVAPQVFKDAFARAKAELGPRFRSIQIVTNDPLTPWELMLPYPRTPEEVARPRLLGLEFAVSREALEQAGNLPDVLDVRDVTAIRPQIAGVEADELAPLRQLGYYREIPPKVPAVCDFLLTSPRGIVHYAGHGRLATELRGDSRFALLLDDQPLDLATWVGNMPTSPRASAFYFFNTCSQGQNDRVLSDVEGWGPALLRSGGCGYLGGLWTIQNDGAVDFALHFYGSLFNAPASGPPPVAEIVRDGRRNFYQRYDPTFLAYVYYGSPGLRLIAR